MKSVVDGKAPCHKRQASNVGAWRIIELLKLIRTLLFENNNSLINRERIFINERGVFNVPLFLFDKYYEN